MNMTKTRWLLVVPVIGMMAAFCGCQQQPDNGIDFGGITNSVYRNVYFGLSVAIPSDWSVQDQEAQRELVATGSKLVYGDDQNKQAILKATELKTVNMFAVFEYPAGSPVPFNPSVMALAEDVRSYPGIKTGKDYLYHVKEQLESGQMQVGFPKPDYSVKMDGVDFGILPLEISIGKKTVHEEYYATIMKGYAISFVIAYATDPQEASLQKILNSIKFKPAEQ